VVDELELLDAGLPVGAAGWFTTRAGGVSPPPWDSLNLGAHVGDDVVRVRVNAERIVARLGVDGLNLPEQVHGVGVLVVEAAGPGLRVHGGADALVTRHQKVAIGVVVADCMPVLLADAAAGVVGAAHAGRRGLAAGVLQATLDAMTGLGAAPERIRAVIGPAICGRCYEVPAELRDEVDAAVPGTACETAAGTPGLDLPAGALRVLRDAGVAVTSVGICTAEDPRFFSYRRDGVTGRFAGLVMLPAHE
jgi:YfiH family protein